MLPGAPHHGFASDRQDSGNVPSQQCVSGTNTDSCSQSSRRAPRCEWQHEVPWQLCAAPHNSGTRKPQSLYHRLVQAEEAVPSLWIFTEH